MNTDYPIEIAQHVANIRPSATLAIAAKAAKMRAAGKDVISLSAGEPDFETPNVAKEAAILAIQNGFTHYTAVDGIASLKEAIIQKFKQENQLDYTPNQILVSCGVKHSIFNLLHALLEPGDEVIIPSPYWVSYPDMVKLFRGVPVFIQTHMEDSFKITPEQLEQVISPRTKLFIFNSPSNPTGVCYTRAELAGLGAVLLKHRKILIASDDIYEHIMWGKESFCNLVNVCPALYERTMVFNGVSKAYAMTGWRIGYAAGPATLIRAMSTVQSQSTSNPNSIAQVAAEAAIRSGTKNILPMVQAFQERSRFLREALSQIPGFCMLETTATFYLFPDVSRAMMRQEFKDDVPFSEALLEKAGIAVVPGTEFGAPGHIRLSFAIGLSQLKEAIRRLENFLNTRMC